MIELPLFLVPGAPLALLILFALPQARATARALVPVAPLPALLVALAPEAPPPLALDWLLLGTRLALTETGATFLAFSALLWALAGWGAERLLARDPARDRFSVCLLLAMTGNLGLLVAQDLGSFYAFFAMMSLASWGLVLHGGGAAQVFAGRIYIAFAILGEVALFAGLAMGAFATGTYMLADLAQPGVPPLALALVAVGFLIKLGAVPLHLWLPLAHSAAPAPASAVLSGAMLKAGLFGLMTVLPLGAVAAPEAGALLAAMAVAGLLIAPLLGLVQGDPKAVLAYSSIGQMSLMALGLGVGLAAPEAWPAIAAALVLLAAHHAFAKAALFLGVPVVWATGIGWPRALVLGAMALPAAALIGLPGTSGGLAKDAIKTAVAVGPGAWAFWLAPALFAASLGTACLMLRAFALLAAAPIRAEVPRGVALPFAVAVGLGVAGLALIPVPTHAAKAAVPSDLLPLAMAAGLAALTLAAVRLARVRLVPPAPGGLLAAFERVPAPAPVLALPAPERRGRALAPRRRRRPDGLAQSGGLAILGMAAALALAAVMLPEPAGSANPTSGAPAPAAAPAQSPAAGD
jgi:formate hydrogenlyase subunit 3/multisubunit Na+/H+ antiporter MnhD subunit